MGEVSSSCKLCKRSERLPYNYASKTKSYCVEWRYIETYQFTKKEFENAKTLAKHVLFALVKEETVEADFIKVEFAYKGVLHEVENTEEKDEKP